MESDLRNKKFRISFSIRAFILSIGLRLSKPRPKFLKVLTFRPKFLTFVGSFWNWKSSSIIDLFESNVTTLDFLRCLPIKYILCVLLYFCKAFASDSPALVSWCWRCSPLAFFRFGWAMGKWQTERIRPKWSHTFRRRNFRQAMAVTSCSSFSVPSWRHCLPESQIVSGW